MKIILLQDVAKIGRRAEIVEVPHGFAQNKLIPQRLAEEATAENLKRHAARERKRSLTREAEDAAFARAKETLAGLDITIAAPANESGHLFEALKPERIAHSLGERGVALRPEQIRIKRQIKEIGAHEVCAVSGKDEHPFTVAVVAA